ncbi:mammalian cell entry protein [Mycobacterium triplex]|uniref:Mammalian cell entry protein n=1 Tax=Mycobacterium triplex TaxID=47839 RepID=A0ABX3VWB8_9MYCO|nr:MlaD family protein [Mycobacterium triplex]ORW99166.1 mammalian cell entry protein [Mycobacterium triplex]
MHLRKRSVIQLVVFTVISLTAALIMGLDYMRLPSLLFGVGHYEVTMRLPESAGLYQRANVTYLGTEVGQVKTIHLTDNGVEAVLSLNSDIAIPADLDAQVHSQTAVGEQYVELLPRNDTAPPLKNGDVIARNRTTIPPDINELLAATNRGLQAIPGDNLKTVIDESYTAFGGLGPEISRLVKGLTSLATDAHKNLDGLTNLADNAAPLLDTQSDTADSVRAWAAHLATVTDQLRTHDSDLGGILRKGPGAADEAHRLLDRLHLTLPIILANLASIAPVLVTYQADLEQLLVLLPLGVAALQATTAGSLYSNNPVKGFQLDFIANLNLPPPCSTGYLPPQQIRSASAEDYPDRPSGDLYCRVPQDSPLDVRGVRNIPCETRPGKRAPTVKMCESDENYVPLNDGFNWKGDPNATLSGQPVPQLPPGAVPTTAPAPSPVAVAPYDPNTGTYIGPDGQPHTQSNLTRDGAKPRTWQDLLTPPKGN